jgi:hypothetical protein
MLDFDVVGLDFCRRRNTYEDVDTLNFWWRFYQSRE